MDTEYNAKEGRELSVLESIREQRQKHEALVMRYEEVFQRIQELERIVGIVRPVGPMPIGVRNV